MGNQPEPVVTLSESYAGSYTGSGSITGFILSLIPRDKNQIQYLI